MAFKVQLSATAKADMTQTTNFIKRRAPASANAWFDGLIDALKSLSEMPARFAAAEESERIGKSLRSMPYRAHRVIYEIDETTQIVSILRVYHSARAPLQLEDLE